MVKECGTEKCNNGFLRNGASCMDSNQTAFVLDYLKEFPNGRHAKTTLWNVAELKDMNLVPCVHSTDWNLDGGRLNLVLQQRSGDMPYGVPFNTTQYAMLQCMFAREIGVKPGILLHCIADAHIYANQMDGVKKQIQRYNMMQCVENIPEDGMVKAFRNQLEYAREAISPDLKDVRELCALLLNVKNAHPEFFFDFLKLCGFQSSCFLPITFPPIFLFIFHIHNVTRNLEKNKK